MYSLFCCTRWHPTRCGGYSEPVWCEEIKDDDHEYWVAAHAKVPLICIFWVQFDKTAPVHLMALKRITLISISNKARLKLTTNVTYNKRIFFSYWRQASFLSTFSNVNIHIWSVKFILDILEIKEASPGSVKEKKLQGIWHPYLWNQL